MSAGVYVVATILVVLTLLGTAASLFNPRTDPTVKVLAFVVNMGYLAGIVYLATQ